MNEENGASELFEEKQGAIDAEEAVNEMRKAFERGFLSYPDTAEMKAVEIGEICKDEIKQRQGQVMIDGRMKENVRKRAAVERIPDLYETVSMMNAEDFDDRMRAEYWQLRIRRMKLERQMDKLIHKHELLDEIDEGQKGLAIDLMRHQLMRMSEYAEILIRRATICGIDLCAGDAEGIAERCIMADKHRQEEEKW